MIRDLISARKSAAITPPSTGEITQLADASVAADMPDISRSLRALDEAMEQRLQQGGVE